MNFGDIGAIINKAKEEKEEIKASIGVPQIFLGNIGRLNEDRFTKHYCNRCRKEYPGSPVTSYENAII